MIFTILDLDEETASGLSLESTASSPRVLLRSEGAVSSATWACAASEDGDSYRLAPDGEALDLSAFQLFDLPGFKDSVLSFAILPPSKVASVIDQPSARAPKAARPEAPAPEAAPAEPAAAPEAAPADKPWISREPVLPAAPPVVDPGLSPAQQSLIAQIGINPRRSRSLQEIIDDKWRHSRLEQLGHPVPPEAGSQPLESPVERAVSAVREAWSNPELRVELISAVTAIEGMESSLNAGREAARKSAVNAALTELEAQRLKMLADMDSLRRCGAEVREELKLEIRRDEAKALQDAVNKTEAARAECARYEAAAAKAKNAAACAEDALNALSDGRFEQRLNEFAINSRAADLLRCSGAPSPIPSVSGASATADELIARVTETFAAAGRPLERNDAVNLLICAAQSPFLLLSGASGSGKSDTVRLLARALGAQESLFAEFAPDDGPAAWTAPDCDAAAIVLLDDANLTGSADMTRGLTPAAERGDALLCMTVQDSGYGRPVSAALYDRAFTIRLADESESAPWEPRPKTCPQVMPAVSREALRRAFAPRAGAVPPMQQERMAKLRSDLAVLGVRLSRRTLDALWNYCAAAVPVMQAEPSAVLDLALAQRALPSILAGAPLEALAALPALIADLPRCKALLAQPLPILI